MVKIASRGMAAPARSAAHAQRCGWHCRPGAVSARRSSCGCKAWN